MVETSPVVAVVLVVLAAGAVPAAALTGVGAGAAQQTATNESANASLAPGERFAGVVGVQQADVQAEVAARAFGQRVAAAASNRSAAGVVADEVDDLEVRLSELDAEITELERAHENGTVSEGQYRARLAQLHAKERALERRLNQTAAVARNLPEAALVEKGVNVTAIEQLRSRASELTGPEVAEIARGIAGSGAGKGMGGPPASAGPPGFVENRTGGPGASGNDTGGPGNGGPPADAGSGNDTGKPDSAGNASAAPKASGSGNGTGASGDAGPRNETGAPDGAGATNETGAAGDAGSGAGSGSAGDGAASSGDGATNATDASGSDSATNATDGSGDGSAGGGAGDAGDGGSSGDAGDGGSARALVAPGVRL